MTSKTHKYVTILCDACGKEHGMPDEYLDVASARRGALDAGWQLIPKIRSNGRPAYLDMTKPRAFARASVTASDVCPDCTPTFTAAVLDRSNSGGGWQSMQSQRTRIDALEAEIAALKRART